MPTYICGFAEAVAESSEAVSSSAAIGGSRESGVFGAGGRVPSCGVPRSGAFDGVSCRLRRRRLRWLILQPFLGSVLVLGCFFFFFFAVSPFNPSGAA